VFAMARRSLPLAAGAKGPEFGTVAGINLATPGTRQTSPFLLFSGPSVLVATHLHAGVKEEVVDC
jgi:hypothetical protein